MDVIEQGYQVIGQDGRTLRPAHPTHPGTVLEAELETRGLKKSAFALQNQIYPSHLTEILKGRRSINASIALKLERALEIEAAFWLRMQINFDLERERRKAEPTHS